MATKPKTPAKTPAAPKNSTADAKRSFDFKSTFKTGVVIPEAAKSAGPRANELPFKEMFTAMLTAALKGENPSQDIPLAYFTEERDIKFDKDGKLVSTGENPPTQQAYIREKVRGAFNAWVKQDEQVRAILGLTQVWRDGSQPEHVLEEGGKPEAFMTVWVVKKAKTPAE